MGLKWTATLRIEFEMLDGRPDSLALAQTVLAREAGLLKHNIEHGGRSPRPASNQVREGPDTVSGASTGLISLYALPGPPMRSHEGTY